MVMEMVEKGAAFTYSRNGIDTLQFLGGTRMRKTSLCPGTLIIKDTI